MHPVLFTIGSFTVYAYGFFIAFGAVMAFLYLWKQSAKKYKVTFDQANTLFIYLVIAGVVGGKLFIIFEEPKRYLGNLSLLISGSGFVFYGSLITAIPVMLWFFRKYKLPALGMIDLMAVCACIVHGFGRIGCFMAGCCYGVPTNHFFGVIFSDPACQAEPKGVPLVPTQLIESAYLFTIMFGLLAIRNKKQFDGQLFLIYLILYAIGRSILELYRGDIDRGFVIGHLLSNSQFILSLIHI